jgi:uncharacterized membrane protein YjdF
MELLNRILEFLNAHLNGAPILGLERDKIAHFLGGALIAFLAALAIYRMVSKPTPFIVVQCFAVGIVMTAAIGALKEWWFDAQDPTRHTVDPADFVATFIGGVCGSLIFGIGVLL